jgi:dsDNA-specific endonuclease/ATPase MutS2
MSFKVGDSVRFLNEVGEGKILEIKKSSALVETEDGFDLEYPLVQLVPAAKTDDFKVDEQDINSLTSAEKFAKRHAVLDKKFNHIKPTKSADILEIDLHIENLIDSHRGMQNFQILEVQMANFRRSLILALSRRLKKMVVIHGVGEGVLRQEIRNELKAYYPNFEFYDASYQVYGYGATEILLKYKQ